MRLREDAHDSTALDGTISRARISAQHHWPKNVQAGQKIGEDRKKL